MKNKGQMYVENYKDLKQSITAREVARKLVLDTASFTYKVTGAINAFLKKPRVQLLYIHHIFKDEEILLRKLIEKLSEHHSFISHSEAVNRILSGDIDKPYVSVSSDDGLKNNLRAGAILAEYNISACFFICPGVIGETQYETIKTFSENQLHLPPVEFMNWKDVEELQKQGHDIGGHTMSHVNMAKCDPQQLTDEIQQCYDKIKKHCGTVNHFAFPYGRFHHFTAKAQNLVFSSGFNSCASAERGCHISSVGNINKEELLLRRDHVILTWPIEHILFFIARNAWKATTQNNYAPYENNNNNK
jgi:peptidoglycan/xylan/chitin deacetylase (PgdA/CDA1 family)